MTNSIKNIHNSAQESFKEFDKFFEVLTKEQTFKLSLGLTVGNFNGLPLLTIGINGKTLSSEELNEGQHFLNFEYDLQDEKEIILEISMSGKNNRDTLIENNKIIKDKFVLIDQLMINNYNIINDIDLFYNKFSYRNNNTNTEEPVKIGFWQNSTLTLRCSLPFSVWYQENTKRNIELSENMQYQDNKILAEHQYTELIEKIKLLK